MLGMVPPNVGAFLQDKEKIHVYLDNESTLDSDFGDMGWDIKWKVISESLSRMYMLIIDVKRLLSYCKLVYLDSVKEKIRRSKWMVQKT